MEPASQPADVDAYSQPRRVQPGCQHNLGCKCGVPYYLRPSSPAERRRERAFQLGPSKLEFLEAAIGVIERRRDELKDERDSLRLENERLKSLISNPSPG